MSSDTYKNNRPTSDASASGPPDDSQTSSRTDPLLHNRELLERFRAGERDAMTTVFDTYSPELVRSLSHGFSFASGGKRLRFSGFAGRGDLHDVLAETFRRAFEQRGRLGYGGVSPYGAYLKSIARNLIIDGYRSGARAPWVSLDDDTTAAAPAERTMEQAELAQLMQQFIAGLDKPSRRFVELRFQRGLSQDDVAAQMRVSRRKVRKLETSLRAALVEALRGTGYLGADGKVAP